MSEEGEKNMAKKWIGNLAELVRLLLIAIVMICVSTGCGNGEGDIGAEGWEKKTSTAVASQSYQDDAGNKIIYYCCKTIYYDENEVAEVGTVDHHTLAAVIDVDQMEERKACMVGQWPALICGKDGRSYLCWTISPEYSCVIEYDAEVVAEEDIFRMAESVIWQQ